MTFENNSLKEFTDALASSSAVPGGGGASALTASMGAALASMVCRLTIGKKKYAQVEDDVKRILKESEELRKKCTALIDGDAEAFLPLSKAYAIPKDDPQRDAVMEQCLRNAAMVPMELVRLSCRGIQLHASLADKGSALALSDVGNGVIFFWASLYGSVMNVHVNTKSMKDRQYADKLNSEADGLVNEYWKIADSTYEKVMERLK